MSTRVIDQGSAALLLKALAPDSIWLLKRIESEGGYARFPPLIVNFIARLNISNYPELYETEYGFGLMFASAFMDPGDIQALGQEFESVAVEERGQVLTEVLESLDAAGESIQFPKTPSEKEQAQVAFDALSAEEKRVALEFWQRFMMAFLAGFHQVLSVMVHGEKLTSLVAQAKAGSDTAFAKAVQIDKRILAALPYFRKRFDDAHSLGDSRFLEDVGGRMHRPPYKGKIRHKTLYLAFAVLDMLGLLRTMKHRELLDLCEQAGMAGYPNRIEDVKNLSKRLKEYFAFQQRGFDLSTP